MTFRIHVYTGSLINPVHFPTNSIQMEFHYKRIGSFVDWFRRTAFDRPGLTKSFGRFWSDGDVEFSEVGGFVFSDDILSTDEIGDVIVFGSQAKETIDLLMDRQYVRVVR